MWIDMDANQNRTLNGTLEWILFDQAMRTRPADHQTVTWLSRRVNAKQPMESARLYSLSM
jgi:hypothetical protein